MKSNCEFSANENGEIVMTQITIMTAQEYLLHAQQVYKFATSMTGMNASGVNNLLENKTD